ncbi:MAG: MFS transporter [Erysipelothrix sp.]|nr:MFS transporter [Erysipelothrix sp.]
MRKRIFGFGTLMFLAFVAHASVNTQAIPFLTEIGYTSTERGYIMAAYALIAMVGQFYAGYLADKYQTVKKWVIYSTIAIIGFSIVTFIYNDKNFLLHLFMMANALGFIRIVGNLLETWILEVDGLYPYFGSIRSFGSLGWALSSLSSGYLIAYGGYELMMWVSIAVSVAVIVLTFALEDASKVSDDTLNFKDVGALFKNKNYVLLVVVFTLIYIVQNADNITVTDYILSLGGNETDIGVKWFVQALSELPLMIFGSYFLFKLRGKKMMMIGGFALGLRYVLYGSTTSIDHVVIFSALQMVSFPFLLISQKELILNESPEHLRSSGQMVAVAFTSGFSSIISPILAGYLGEYFALNLVLIGMGLFMSVPILLMSFYKLKNIT